MPMSMGWIKALLMQNFEDHLIKNGSGLRGRRAGETLLPVRPASRLRVHEGLERGTGFDRTHWTKRSTSASPCRAFSFAVSQSESSTLYQAISGMTGGPYSRSRRFMGNGSETWTFLNRPQAEAKGLPRS